MEGMDNPQHPGAMAADVEDEFFAPDADDMGDYPPIAAPHQCSKGWDPSLLQNCTAARLRGIAKNYDGVDANQNKLELFKAIYNAMLEDQTCESCPEGKCNPAIHYFPPTDNPPSGWVRGTDGIFVKPATPRSVNQPGTSSMQDIATPSSSAVSSDIPSINTGTVSFANLPAVTSQQQVGTPAQLTATTPLQLAPRVPGSPSNALLRPTGTPDLPVYAGGSPYIPGIQQQPPAPRDPAQFVVRGAAALSAAQNAGVMTRSTTTAQSRPAAPQLVGASSLPPRVDANTMEQARQSIAAAKLRRQKEMEEANRLLELQQQQLQQRQNAQLALQHQQLMEAERAEEAAHQEKLRQLRAGHAAATTGHLLGAQQMPHQSFPAPPLQPAFQPQTLSPLANLAAPSPYIPIPATSHPTSSLHVQHSPQNHLFGSPNAHLTPPAGSPAAALPVTPEQIQQMVAQQVQALTRLPAVQSPHCHSHSGSSVCGEHGKLKTNKVVNTGMAARFGVFATPTFEIDGEIESGDISKMQKVLTAGHDKVGTGMVLRQAAWPHKMLQSSVPGYNVVPHEDLTFHQFINGMLSKLTSETPEERLDHELANKLSMLQFLVEMSFHYEHKVVIKAYHEIHMAWQMKTFDWSDSWSSIEERLKTIRSKASVVPQQQTFKKNFKCSSCTKPNGGGGGQGPPHNAPGKQSLDTVVNGVPTNYMKAQNICIRFNKQKGCPEATSHKINPNTDVTLRHICAGCHKKSNLQETHPVHDCEKGPFKPLFRGW